MLKLKFHTKPINEYTDIDRCLLVPKKLWDDFPVGQTSLKLNGKSVKTRIYDIFCECTLPKHSHRIVDLRNVWQEINAKENEVIQVER